MFDCSAVQKYQTKTFSCLNSPLICIYWQKISDSATQLVDWWLNSIKQLRTILSLQNLEKIWVLYFWHSGDLLCEFISITYIFLHSFFQVKEPESFRQLSLPQIEIPFRDMASIVTEAEAAIVHRFEVLEPQIYNSNARQVPKSPEWFMSASSKIKVIAKNMTKVALVAEEVAWFNLFDLQALCTKWCSRPQTTDT